MCEIHIVTLIFFPGYRAAYEPGGRRTGAPGEHISHGKAKYRIIDENVRYYVAPAIEDLKNSPVRCSLC